MKLKLSTFTSWQCHRDVRIQVTVKPPTHLSYISPDLQTIVLPPATSIFNLIISFNDNLFAAVQLVAAFSCPLYILSASPLHVLTLTKDFSLPVSSTESIRSTTNTQLLQQCLRYPSKFHNRHSYKVQLQVTM